MPPARTQQPPSAFQVAKHPEAWPAGLFCRHLARGERSGAARVCPRPAAVPHGGRSAVWGDVFPLVSSLVPLTPMTHLKRLRLGGWYDRYKRPALRLPARFRNCCVQSRIRARRASSDHRSNGGGVRGPARRHRRGALWEPVYVGLGPEIATEGAGERATLRTGMGRGLVTVVTTAPAHLSALPCPWALCGLSPRLANTACWAGRSTCWGMRCGPMGQAAPFVVVLLTAVMHQVRCCGDRSSWFASCPHLAPPAM
jgi:hypothetical protein